MYNENKRLSAEKWRKNHKVEWETYIKQYREEHSKEVAEKNKKFREEHPGYGTEYYRKRRLEGYTKVCTKNYECIENYELAKADNFDRNKWHLHHRLEQYWSPEKLRRKGLYQNINPEALIWLPAYEHNSDKSIAAFNPENSKWHKYLLDYSMKTP